MSPFLVKAAITVYGAFALVSIVLLWKNASAPDALKNTGVVIASILPIVITVFAYLIPEKMETSISSLLIFDEKEKKLVFGEHFNPYFGAYIPVIVDLPSDKIPPMHSFSELSGDKGLDLVERGVLQSLVSTFHFLWDFKYREHSSPGASFLGIHGGSNEGKTVIGIEKLKSVFAHNQIITIPDILKSNLCLPPKSTIHAYKQENVRKIFLDNPMLEVEISISHLYAGPLQQGVWGLIKPDQSMMNRYFGATYAITIIGKTKMAKNHSPGMAAYKQWYENIKFSLLKLDWKKIESEIERDMIRQSINKTIADS